MSQLGILFNRQFRTLLHEVMTLTPHDYEVLVSLCRNGIASLCRRIRAIGTFESFIVDYFNEHQPMCCRQILTLKPTLLAMARCYVDNMVAFCLQGGLTATAHDWVIAGRHIIALQEMEATAETFITIHKHLDQFFQCFDKVSAAVYIEYQSLDRRLAEEHEKEIVETLYLPFRDAPSDDTPAQSPVADTPSRANDAWTAFYGRDILWFHISDDGSTISDTTVVDNCGHYEYEYTGITENATVVRNGLAFFFADFDKNCEAHQDNDGDWVVTRENDFIKMSAKEMKKFKTLLKTISGMNHFIPDVLSPKNPGFRTDGKPNNRSGKYRIDPRPGGCSEKDSSDAMLTT